MVVGAAGPCRDPGFVGSMGAGHTRRSSQFPREDISALAGQAFCPPAWISTSHLALVELQSLQWNRFLYFLSKGQLPQSRRDPDGIQARAASAGRSSYRASPSSPCISCSMQCFWQPAQASSCRKRPLPTRPARHAGNSCRRGRGNAAWLGMVCKAKEKRTVEIVNVHEVLVPQFLTA